MTVEQDENSLNEKIKELDEQNKTSIYIKRQNSVCYPRNREFKYQKKEDSIDPDKRWIATWNHFLNRIRLFFSGYIIIINSLSIIQIWVYEERSMEEWYPPDFVKIKKKQTKCINPYVEKEIWEREEILTILKYKVFKRNKAIMTLVWDLDARPHEITLLRIKYIRLKEQYGEGEIPHQAKTGSGPILLTLSFTYIRDWLWIIALRYHIFILP